MPSSITHQMIAENAKDDFPEQVRRAAEKHRDYFFLGAQGPDVFFFYRILYKKEQNLGKFMHRHRVYDVFTFLQTYLAAKKDAGEEYERLLAYAAGYICHYCADTSFHPFVYRYLERHAGKGWIHQLIESDWDVYFAGEAGIGAEHYSFPFSARKINRENILFPLYRDLSEAFGRRKVTKQKFQAGISLYEWYLKFFHKKSHQRGWEKAERLLRMKPRLSCLYPRSDPNPDYLSSEEFYFLSEERGKDADALFDRAVSESARLVRSFAFAVEEETRLSKEEFSNSFLTAQPVE